MKLISWNVNGIRSVLKKGFLEFLEKEAPDVMCIQETKASAEQVDVVWPAGYQGFWNSAEKKGYSGTLILTRINPVNVTCGISIADHDREGRVITAEYADFFLVNVYVPNSKRELTRLEYRQTWDRDFLAYLQTLEKQKPMIFCGDMNVAHTEIDLARPKQNTKTHGFTPEERAGFGAFVDAGFIDTFRAFFTEGGHYTWWSQMANARSRDIGWRIDYVLCSPALKDRLKTVKIYKDMLGSDHCPVGLELKA